jgi:hypothetical protein
MSSVDRLRQDRRRAYFGFGAQKKGLIDTFVKDKKLNSNQSDFHQQSIRSPQYCSRHSLVSFSIKSLLGKLAAFNLLPFWFFGTTTRVLNSSLAGLLVIFLAAQSGKTALSTLGFAPSLLSKQLTVPIHCLPAPACSLHSTTASILDALISSTPHCILQGTHECRPSISSNSHRRPSCSRRGGRLCVHRHGVGRFGPLDIPCPRTGGGHARIITPITACNTPLRPWTDR